MKKAKILFFGIIFLIVVLFSLSKIDVVKNPAFGQAVLFEARQDVPTTVNLFGNCKTLTSTAIKPLMIPTSTLEEWNAFLSNIPAGVTVSNDCFCPSQCMPSTATPPTLTLTRRSLTSIRLNWTEPTPGPILGYRIQRRPRNGTWATVIADTGNTTLMYTNTGLTSNTEYEFQVAAINAAGVGEYSLSMFLFTGHCMTTTASCPSGYSTIVGGTQTGCATAGPVNSPYPDDTTSRYRILENTQVLTTTCSNVGTQQRTRQAQFSTNSGTSYTYTGSQVNCRSCVRGSTCASVCNAGVICSGYLCRNMGCHCMKPSYCHVTSGWALCCASTPTKWNRTCADQSDTIRWCCRT